MYGCKKRSYTNKVQHLEKKLYLASLKKDEEILEVGRWSGIIEGCRLWKRKREENLEVIEINELVNENVFVRFVSNLT